MITIYKQPTDKVAVYRPVIWEVQSDRVSSKLLTVTAVTQDGTNIYYTISTDFTDADIRVGDIILPSLVDSFYYKKQEVVSVDYTNKYIYTEFAFDGTTTGTLVRTNENFKVKAELYAVNDEPVLDITQFLDAGNGETWGYASIEHGYSAGEFIEITNSTNYNGLYKIVAAGEINFKFTKAFVAHETGNVQKLSEIGTKLQAPIIYNSDTIFRFDFSNFLKTILAFDSVIANFGITSDNKHSIKPYILIFTETFNDKDGLYKEADILENIDIAKKCCNITLQHEEVQNLNVFTQDNTSKRFLTNQQNDSKIIVGSYLQLHFLTDISTVKGFMRKYYKSGNYADITTSDTTIIKNRGIISINTTGFEDCNYIIIKLLKTDDTVISETRQYYLGANCNNAKIWWLNRLGGMDNYTFTGNKSEEIKIKSQIYKQRIAEGFYVEDRGETTLSVKADTEKEVYSSFLSEAEANWLSELFTSPMIFEQRKANLIPIIPLNSSFKKNETEKLTQVKFSYKLANALITQDN